MFKMPPIFSLTYFLHAYFFQLTIDSMIPPKVPLGQHPVRTFLASSEMWVFRFSLSHEGTSWATFLISWGHPFELASPLGN